MLNFCPILHCDRSFQIQGGSTYNSVCKRLKIIFTIMKMAPMMLSLRLTRAHVDGEEICLRQWHVTRNLLHMIYVCELRHMVDDTGGGGRGGNTRMVFWLNYGCQKLSLSLSLSARVGFTYSTSSSSGFSAMWLKIPQEPAGGGWGGEEG
jgi:hypothetical protein